MKKRKIFIGYYHYGVILTYISVVSAITGICFSVGGNRESSPWVGVICLLISGVCDAFDGAVARTRKNRTREDQMFGERIDSLSDLIAFGVAPAMIGFGMKINRWFFIPVYAIFVLCALIRLAYFDVTEELRTQDPNCGKRKYYEGLPVTAVAFGVPIFYLVATMFPEFSNGRTAVMLFGYLLIAVLFVSPFKLPKPGVKAIVVIMAILAVILAALLFVHLKVLA
ncbi:MAG: CDP-alcohol phosphatidyltransferase family protein [Clostridia bacterium]|nr:CDP-alcohol phosphatidyltransferase family protein [Clostridia bacterium]